MLINTNTNYIYHRGSNKNISKPAYEPSQNHNNIGGGKSVQGKKIAVGAAGIGLVALIGTKVKPIAKYVQSTFKTLSKRLDKKLNPDKNVLMDVSSIKGRDLDENFKNSFMKNFIENIKDPFKYVKGKDGKPEKKLVFYPPNGYMLTGPKSEAREERFNWMLDELKKAGVEVIDPSDGKQSKYPQLSDAWWEMWGKNNDEEFKKTGKFRAFVVRGLDDIGQPEGYPEGWFKFPDGCLLKDSPDSNESCRRHGIMLFYTCRDTTKVDPAVIRTGRIDRNYCPTPKEHEPLEIWKEYLKEVKTYNPSFAVNKLEAAKEVLSKRGEEVMKEMEPHFAYTIPYVTPRAHESEKKWADYIEKTSKDVDSKKAMKYMLGGLDELEGNLPKTPEGNKKYETIYKMMEDAQKPEDLALWKKHIQCRKDHIHIAYVD